MVVAGGLIIYLDAVSLPGFGFFQKMELLKFFRELFANERSYPSTAKIWRMYIRCAYYMPEQVAVI